MPFGFFVGKPPPVEEVPWLDQSAVEAFGLPTWLDALSVRETFLLWFVILFFVMVHIFGHVTPMKKHATLDMGALNRVNIFKEVFLGYVNAGMLEPILAIASSEYDVSNKSLITNMMQLVGLCSWLYLLTDAFDVTDTQQAFIYWDRITKQGKAQNLPKWFKRKEGAAAHDEGYELSGSLFCDISLWFMLCCSLFACFGVVSHRDVIHSHAILVLWIILHHQSRRATSWRGTGYFHTLFAPSTALLPLEFCLNLIDQEMVGDEDGLEDLDKWRTFIKIESGVELTIEA